MLALSLRREIHVNAFAFLECLFDLRVMPLESPSCNERKVRGLLVGPDKTGMRSLVPSLSFLALRLWLYIYFTFFA